MALEDVRAFYQRLARDQEFSQQIQSVKSKDECSQKVQEAGFDFTQEEFEEYTSQLLEASETESELQDLSEKELELVFGGASSYIDQRRIHPMYGVVIWPPRYQPMYGIIRDPGSKLSSP